MKGLWIDKKLLIILENNEFSVFYPLDISVAVFLLTHLLLCWVLYSSFFPKYFIFKKISK